MSQQPKTDHTKGGSKQEQTSGVVFECADCSFTRKFLVEDGSPAVCPRCGSQSFGGQVSQEDLVSIEKKIALLQSQKDKLASLQKDKAASLRSEADKLESGQ